MPEIVEKDDRKHIYIQLKQEMRILRVVGRVLILIFVGFGIINLIVLGSNLFDIPFRTNISMLLGLINIVIIAVALICLLLGSVRFPKCADCGQRIKYLYKEDQFYCKHCKKYF